MNVLVVANQTLASRKVFERIAWLRQEQGELSVHVIVPLTASDDAPNLAHDHYGRPVIDYLAVDAANARLRQAMSTLEEMGNVEVTGELGNPDPLTSIRDAIAARDYGRIVLSTLPSGTSRWLKMDLIHRAQRLADPIPVDHVVGDLEEPTRPGAPRTWRDLGVPGKSQLDVLLVDDNEADRELTTVALERAPIECVTREAKNGQEALEMVAATAPDLILLDLSMPGISGLETLEMMRDNERMAAVPVVVLTTSDRDEDRQRAHELGAAAYVVKENDFNQFEAVLLGVLSEVAAPS